MTTVLTTTKMARRLARTMHATSYPAGFGVHQPTVTDVAWSRSVTANWPRARPPRAYGCDTARPPRGVEPERTVSHVRLALADADAVKEPL